MSTFEVKILRPYKIMKHPAADRLDLVTFGGEMGYTCVTGRDNFTLDSLIIYIPPDSVIPDSMVARLAAKSKIKLENRIRAVKIRGCFSEGLCLDPKEWLLEMDLYREGDDVANELGITKWEPPASKNFGGAQSQGQSHRQNPYFKSYNDVEHMKKYPDVLVEGEEVIVECKTHGTSSRHGYVKIEDLSWWKKLLNRVIHRPNMEYLVGSHNAIKKSGGKTCGFYKEDVWHRISEEYKLEETTKLLSQLLGGKSVTIYGEIYGPGIQKVAGKDYSYGVPEGKLAWKVFDIKVDGIPLDYDEVIHWCAELGLPMWPILYRGPFSHEKIKELTHNVVDTYNGLSFDREGTVTRPIHERRDPRCGRILLKLINEKYFLLNNTDYH
jgi:RNA ligase (TIGR02306 family)